jgi:hypothetical protein
MNKRELWLRINNYQFDNLVPSHLWSRVLEAFGNTDASTKAFAQKIARKHKWNTRFAIRAVKEYKKFIYLGAVSNFIVTPSKTIDVVWHEHLLFTKAYREFCDTIIGFQFDHQPELIPITDQNGIFSAQYLDTLKLYKKEFDINPPSDIWNITKFDSKLVTEHKYASQKKQLALEGDSGPYSSDAPLYTYFDSSELASFTEFGCFDGGDGGGAGASGSWDSGGDIDLGSSDSACSSCSSGCSSD